MNQMMQIANQEIQVKGYQGRRVITLKDVDTVHQRPEGTAGRNFRENKERFIYGVDYFQRNSSEAKLEFNILAPNGLTLLTESGYLMLVKSFTDDLAWTVQRQLVNYYFKVKNEIHSVKITEEKVLTKKEYLKILDCLSKTSNETLSLFKAILTKIAPGEFDNLQPISNVSMKVRLPDSFGQRLLKALQENNMTQTELAEKLSVQKSTISHYVNGKTKPRYDALQRLIDILQVNFYE